VGRFALRRLRRHALLFLLLAAGIADHRFHHVDALDEIGCTAAVLFQIGLEHSGLLFLLPHLLEQVAGGGFIAALNGFIGLGIETGDLRLRLTHTILHGVFFVQSVVNAFAQGSDLVVDIFTEARGGNFGAEARCAFGSFSEKIIETGLNQQVQLIKYIAHNTIL
jgi:hypothetical protein